MIVTQIQHSGENMNRICFGLSLFVLLLMMPNVIAATIFVPDDFPTIQQAIDAASERDTIVVRDGVYYENLNVDKQLTIKSENGSARCIIDGRGKGNVVTLKADGITLEGFTIRNSGRAFLIIFGTNYAGVKIYSDDNILTRNNIVNNYYGICLVYSTNNSITNNIISSNNYYDIYLDGSWYNRVTNNKFINDGIAISGNLEDWTTHVIEN